MNAAAIVHQHEEEQDMISSPDTMKIRKSRVCTEPNETMPVDTPVDTGTLFPYEPLVRINDENHKMVPATSSSAEQDRRPHTGRLGRTRDTYALGNHKSPTKTLPQQVGNSSQPTSQQNGAPSSALSDSE